MCYTGCNNLYNNRGNEMDRIFNVMDRMFKLEYIGVLFIAFGFGMFLGIVGYVEDLQYIGYTETIKIGTRIILSTFLMLVGIRIYDGK
jgi:hypothetical protein|tara:strand:- start:631 stop:894 length:264 start_codon:yes stop_codon:yes gene_type:complete